MLRSRRARALRHLAYALDRNGRRAAARQAAAGAVAIQRQLLGETPSDESEKEQIELSQKVLTALGEGSGR